MSNTRMEKIEFGGWKNCLRLFNDAVSVVATTDVGPRVMSLSAPGGTNVFKCFAADAGRTGGGQWRAYGGHRLWHAPEHPERTYEPDNEPVEHSFQNGILTLTQSVEPATGIRKSMSIQLFDGSPRVRVEHRLENRGEKAVLLAPWGLSVMAPGGRAIVPQEPYAPHPDALLPARPLVLWPYTDMSDSRITWGKSHIVLRHDPEKGPTKFGVHNTRGFALYENGGQVFLKLVTPRVGESYPDFESNFEFFTNQEMLELETLGVLAPITPGESSSHVEDWFLFPRQLPKEEEAFAPIVEGIVAEARALIG